MESRLLWGTLEMLVLEVVSREPSYGYQIAQDVMSASSGYFEIKEGSLYPALHRMERQKLLTSSWQPLDEGRRRKYYKLTPGGRRELQRRREEWRQFSMAVKGVLEGGGG